MRCELLYPLYVIPCMNHVGSFSKYKLSLQACLMSILDHRLLMRLALIGPLPADKASESI